MRQAVVVGGLGEQNRGLATGTGGGGGAGWVGRLSAVAALPREASGWQPPPGAGPGRGHPAAGWCAGGVQLWRGRGPAVRQGTRTSGAPRARKKGEGGRGKEGRDGGRAGARRGGREGPPAEPSARPAPPSPGWGPRACIFCPSPRATASPRVAGWATSCVSPATVTLARSTVRAAWGGRGGWAGMGRRVVGGCGEGGRQPTPRCEGARQVSHDVWRRGGRVGAVS